MDDLISAVSSLSIQPTLRDSTNQAPTPSSIKKNKKPCREQRDMYNAHVVAARKLEESGDRAGALAEYEKAQAIYDGDEILAKKINKIRVT